MITLFCWVYDDKNAFSIDISRDKAVDKLKEAIFAKNPNRFQGIDAYSKIVVYGILSSAFWETYWKVEIESRNKEELRNIQLRRSPDHWRIIPKRWACVIDVEKKKISDLIPETIQKLPYARVISVGFPIGLFK